MRGSAHDRHFLFYDFTLKLWKVKNVVTTNFGDYGLPKALAWTITFSDVQFIYFYFFSCLRDCTQCSRAHVRGRITSRFFLSQLADFSECWTHSAELRFYFAIAGLYRFCHRVADDFSIFIFTLLIIVNILITFTNAGNIVWPVYSQQSSTHDTITELNKLKAPSLFLLIIICCTVTCNKSNYKYLFFYKAQSTSPRFFLCYARTQQPLFFRSRSEKGERGTECVNRVTKVASSAGLPAVLDRSTWSAWNERDEKEGTTRSGGDRAAMRPREWLLFPFSSEFHNTKHSDGNAALH